MNALLWTFNIIFMILPGLLLSPFLGWWIIFALLLNGVVAVAANTRGRMSGGWFLLGCLITPLIAGLLVLALPSKKPLAVKVVG